MQDQLEAHAESEMVHPIVTSHLPEQAALQVAEAAAAEVAAAEETSRSEHLSQHNHGMDSEVQWLCYCGKSA